MKVEWEDLREPLRFEINKITEKIRSNGGSLTSAIACDLKILCSIIEKSYTIEMFEDEYEGNSSGTNYGNGYSGTSRNRGRNYSYNRSYSRGDYGTNMPNYTNGQSGYDAGYSGHGETEIFKSQLQAMINSAGDANTRMALQEAMSSLK